MGILKRIAIFQPKTEHPVHTGMGKKDNPGYERGVRMVKIARQKYRYRDAFMVRQVIRNGANARVDKIADHADVR